MRPESFRSQNDPTPLDEAEPVPKTFNLTWLVVILVATGLGLAGWKVVGSSSGGWLHDIGAGVDASEASGKPMFVLYTADWCPPCRKLKRDVLSDPDVDAFLSDNYVRVKIDLTDRGGPNAMTASEYGVNGIPTVIVYDYAGVEINRVTGGGALTYWLRKIAY